MSFSNNATLDLIFHRPGRRCRHWLVKLHCIGERDTASRLHLQANSVRIVIRSRWVINPSAHLLIAAAEGHHSLCRAARSLLLERSDVVRIVIWGTDRTRTKRSSIMLEPLFFLHTLDPRHCADWLLVSNQNNYGGRSRRLYKTLHFANG